MEEKDNFSADDESEKEESGSVSEDSQEGSPLQPQKHKVVRKKIKIKSVKKTLDEDFNFQSFGTRRQGRLYATQALYQYDMNAGKMELEDLLKFEYERRGIRKKVLEFASAIVSGTIENLKRIDEIIEKHSTNWNIERIGVVDKAILRFSIYSLLYQDDVPRSVVIDEAIEIAKVFGERETYKFINGILDGIKKEEK